MKKILIAAAIFVLSITIYSFAQDRKTVKEIKPQNVKPLTTYFFKYNSSSLLKADIQNRSNYIRTSESCGGTQNVCGVYLTTNKPANQPPDATEFDAVKDDLWTSQNNHASVDTIIIIMKT